MLFFLSSMAFCFVFFIGTFIQTPRLRSLCESPTEVLGYCLARIRCTLPSQSSLSEQR